MSERPDQQAAAGGGEVTAVVFDLGGVLIDWDPRHLYRDLFDDPEEMERFLAEICTHEWHYQHDLGRPLTATGRELAAQHPEHRELIQAWTRQEDMVGGAIEGSVEILAALQRAGVPLYALTNWSAEPFPWLRETFEFLDWFEGIVVSSHERMAKPDPRIFECLLERYELAAEETLFVDDSPQHVEAAARLGLRTHHFVSPERLERELEGLGLLPRPGHQPS